MIRKSKLFYSLILTVFMSFYSCENEPLEGFDLVIETPTSTSPGNTTGGNSGSTDILLKKINILMIKIIFFQSNLNNYLN